MGLLSKVKSFVKSQPSRIKNVGATFAAIGKNVASVVGLAKPTKITANVKNPIVKRGLEIVANNPFKSALVAGTVANIPKAVALVKKKTSKSMGTQVTGTTAAPGMLDINSLGKQKTGLLTKAKEMVTGSTTTTTTATGSTSTGVSSSPRKRARRTKSRKASKKRSKSRKKRYGTARQYARKGGKSVKYTKNGQPYIILSDGRARFVKGRRKK